MKNQGEISTLIGIIIIVAVAIVLFGGVFAWQYISKSETPISNVQPNPNIQNSNSETASWKTYINNSVGYEIKFPSQYSATTSECPVGRVQQQQGFYNAVAISDKNNKFVSICYLEGTVDDFFETSKSNISIINGVTFRKEDLGTDRSWYYIQKDSSHILFMQENWAGQKDIVDKIISTFKFIP